jgi:hypothetical protein
MKKVPLLVFALMASSCIVPDQQRINEDRGSETGRSIRDLDATERAKRQRARQAQLMKSDRRG